MARTKTTDDLIMAVRSKLDEDNTAHISNERDIIPSLNRALDYTTSIMSLKYESPLLTSVEVPYNKVLKLPEDIYEDRVVQIEFLDSYVTPINRISITEISKYIQTLDIFYYLNGKEINFINDNQPLSNTVRIWYIKSPPLVTPVLGRITVIGSDNQYVLVDEVREGISTDIDSMQSFVNLVNHKTGEVRGTLQVQYIQGQKIQFKTAFEFGRTSAWGMILSTSLQDLGVELDDYICNVEGACVLHLNQPLFNFIVQYSTAELRGEKLNEENEALYLTLSKLEKHVERLGNKRPTIHRVKSKNTIWSRSNYANRLSNLIR